MNMLNSKDISAFTIGVQKPNPFHKNGRRKSINEYSDSEILWLALSNGVFIVSWRYRDDYLRKKCGKLTKQGLMKKIRCAPGSDQFVPASNLFPL